MAIGNVYKNLVKFGHVVFELCELTQINVHTGCAKKSNPLQFFTNQNIFCDPSGGVRLFA